MLASITILIKNRQKNIAPLNKLLSQHAHIVIARLGVNLKRHCLKGCAGLICLIVEDSKKEIDQLVKKLNNLKDITTKNTIIKS